MEVVVSAGKAVIVPSFSGLTAEEAAMNYPDLNVTVKHAFHADVAYGSLISQSVEPDTKLTNKDDKSVTVTYSQGRPYLHDFRGQSEGDLPKLFYEQYKSKGADINYIVKYVDSSELKGTVVDMGVFNEFVPMTYTVEAELVIMLLHRLIRQILVKDRKISIRSLVQVKMWDKKSLIQSLEQKNLKIYWKMEKILK